MCHSRIARLMVRQRHALFLLGLMLSFSHAIAADTQFNTDSAMANLRTIVEDIGPRPMGSPAEHRALEYALERLHASGCQDTFLMPFTQAGPYNTQSGVAVGIAKGRTGRIILIGGHMDSAGPDVPGANDDGSGSACVLEVARVLAARPHEATLVFCLWGGEEMGLWGSQYFVNHFNQIDSVALMIQLDMVDGAGALDADPDGPHQVSAPRWLLDAAFDVFYNEQHGTGLRYPSQFATLNSSGAGATGSDHDSFLERGIPAIDFTSEIAYPIHTPLDKLSLFDSSGLKRAGDLAIGLVNRFDAGQPPKRTEKYWVFQVGNVPLFVSHGVIRGFIAVAVFLACWLFVSLYRRERLLQLQDVRLTGIKILAATVFVNILLWMSPDAVGLMNGYRYPWAAHFSLYVGFGLCVGITGLLLALRWLQTVQISQSTAFLYLRAATLPLALSVLCAWFDLELAVYPAAILLLFVLAIWVRRPLTGLVLLLLSLWVAVSLVFGESPGFIQRMITSMGLHGIFQWASYDAVLIVVFSVLSLPFAYAGAAYYRNMRWDSWKLRIQSVPRWTIGGGIGIIVLYAAGLAFVRPYDSSWEPKISVTQSWSPANSSGNIIITSSESLKGAIISHDGKDSVVVGSPAELLLSHLSLFPDAWCSVESHDSTAFMGDSTLYVERTLTIRTPIRPYSLAVSFDSKTPFDAVSPWEFSAQRSISGSKTGDRSKTLTWYSFPSTPIVVPVRFMLTKGQVVRQEVVTVFDTLSTSVRIEHAMGYVTKRLTITRVDSLKATDFH
jgi:hypothetical protein